MATRARRGRCGPQKPELPARRAACRRERGRDGGSTAEELLGEPARIYVVGVEADAVVVDVVDAHGVLRERWEVGELAGDALAAALLRDATGHAPRPSTTEAFAREVLGLLPAEGFAISSSEVCAWLLIRAIERAA